MLAYAEREFALTIPDEEGVALIDHIQQIEESGLLEEAERQRDCGPFPDELSYLYEIFHEMNNGRGGNGFGPNSLSYTEIMAYSGLSGIQFEPWEISVVRKLDHAWLKVWNARPSGTKS